MEIVLEQLLKVVIALAMVASTLASLSLPTQASLELRLQEQECWDISLSADETYYPTTFQARASVDMADLFEIKYSGTYKVVISKLAQEQYVLTQCGQTTPTDEQVNSMVALASGYTRKHFTVPVQSAMAMSTVHLGFIDRLGVQDRISFVDQYAAAPCWQMALGCGAQTEDQYATDYNSSHLAWQKASADVIFMSCNAGPDCSNVNAAAKGVHVPTTQDSGLLHTAEYIKFIAAFFNKEPAANSLFDTTKTHFEQAASGAQSQLVVAWVSFNSWGGAAFIVSQATYKLSLVTHAGGTNFDANTSLASVPGLTVSDAVFGNPAAGKTYSVDATDKAAASTSFFAALSDVDVVIDETYAWDPTAYNFESFLSTYGLASNSTLKFITNQMVLRTDRTVSEGNGLDWFESRVAHPDAAAEGLAHSMHQDATKPAKYFRNIAKGETVDQVLASGDCTIPLPVCVDDAVSAYIKLNGPVCSDGGECASGSRRLGLAVGVATLAAVKAALAYF